MSRAELRCQAGGGAHTFGPHDAIGESRCTECGEPSRRSVKPVSEVTKAVKVPPGWKPIPPEPTPEIIERLCASLAPGEWPTDYRSGEQAIRRRNARLAYLEMFAALKPPV